MHRANGWDREGYIERVREREKKRESKRESKRKRVWDGGERSTQFGEGSINGPSNRGRVVLTLIFDELFVTLNDLWGHTYFHKIFAYS